jgi:hypothetical protein
MSFTHPNGCVQTTRVASRKPATPLEEEVSSGFIDHIARRLQLGFDEAQVLLGAWLLDYARRRAPLPVVVTVRHGRRS